MTERENRQLNDLLESFVRAIELTVDSEDEFRAVIKTYISTLAITCVNFKMPEEVSIILMTQFMLEVTEHIYNLLEDMYSENPKGETDKVKYNVEDFIKFKNRRSTDKED